MNSSTTAQSDSLKRFMEAAADARNGDYGRAKSLIEKIRREHGDKAANTARAELWAYAQSTK